MKTMHMHKDSESRLLINCMTRIFPPLVASTRETQLELWESPFWDVMLGLFIWAREGRKNHSNKSQLSDVLKILIS